MFSTPLIIVRQRTVLQASQLKLLQIRFFTVKQVVMTCLIQSTDRYVKCTVETAIFRPRITSSILTLAVQQDRRVQSKKKKFLVRNIEQSVVNQIKFQSKQVNTSFKFVLAQASMIEVQELTGGYSNCPKYIHQTLETNTHLKEMKKN